MSAPIDRMIDAAVRCTKCGIQGIGNCDCWNTTCICCGGSISFNEQREVREGWESRLDGYCIHCAACRCDAYPDQCPTRGTDLADNGSEAT